MPRRSRSPSNRRGSTGHHDRPPHFENSGSARRIRSRDSGESRDVHDTRDSSRHERRHRDHGLEYEVVGSARVRRGRDRDGHDYGDKDTKRSHRSSRDEDNGPDREEALSRRRKEAGARSKRPSRHEEQGEEDEELLLDLAELGVTPISQDDYFYTALMSPQGSSLRSAEYRYWLKAERGKYLDELSSDDAHKYFRRFARRWNDGALKERYYRPPHEVAVDHTRHRWSFTSNPAVDPSDLSRARESVDQLTHSPTRPRPRGSFSHSPTSRPRQLSFARPQSPDSDIKAAPRHAPADDSAVIDNDESDIGPSLPPSGAVPVPVAASRPLRAGPSRPTTSDLQLAHEDAVTQRARERKQARTEGFDRADDAVPRERGKEGKMDEKRAINAGNRAMREKEVGGLEVDEGTLLGDGGSFAAALRARDSARIKREEAKAAHLAERRVADEERLMERKQKDNDTMAMFKALAKERFG